jgi:hypothetical protein
MAVNLVRVNYAGNLQEFLNRSRCRPVWTLPLCGAVRVLPLGSARQLRRAKVAQQGDPDGHFGTERSTELDVGIAPVAESNHAPVGTAGSCVDRDLNKRCSTNVRGKPPHLGSDATIWAVAERSEMI